MAYFVQLVDRILQQQKARRQATERTKLEGTEAAEREEVEKVRSVTNALSISNLSYADKDSDHTNKYPITPSRYGDSKLVTIGNSKYFWC